MRLIAASFSASDVSVSSAFVRLSRYLVALFYIVKKDFRLFGIVDKIDKRNDLFPGILHSIIIYYILSRSPGSNLS